MKKLVIIGICLLLAIPAMGQRTARLLEAGDAFYRNEEYTKAVESYERILRRDRSPEIRKEVSFKLGESYRQLLNYSEAWKWYSVAMNVGYDDPVIYLHLSEMSLGLEDFDSALHYAQKFLKHKPGDQIGEKILESALFSKENYFLETLIEVTNEAGINTLGQEWGVGFFENVAVFHQDPERRADQYDIDIQLRYNNIIYWALRSERLKERIVFASTKDESGRLDARTGTGYSSIYQATYSRRHGQWDPPTLLQGGINSDYYEGFLSYHENSRTGFFMNCGGYRGNRATCDIYTATYDPTTDTWSTPVMFPFNSDEFNVGYPSISEDGLTLYFASDMPGGYGGYDLYKIKKDPAASLWGEPANLGPVINTEFNDAYPFIAGNILYFSSFGHPGFGGFDIFYSVIDEDGNYAEPINMGAPINSSADDFSFIINDEYTRGYFTSNRPGGAGDDDIYSFRVIPETFNLTGVVTDRRTSRPIADIEIFVYGDDDKLHSFVTDHDGLYQVERLSSGVNYHVEVIHPEYYPYSEYFSVKEKLIASRFLVITDFEKDIELLPVAPLLLEEDEITADPLEIRPMPDRAEMPYDELVPEAETFPVRPDIYGERDGLPVIYFDFGNASLTPLGRQQADSVVAFLKNRPGAGLVVHGHTDEVSGYLFNFYLSQRRAHTIVEYLVSQGVEPGRLYPFGHGKMELAVRNAQTPEEHQLNRRGEFEAIPLDGFNRFLSQAPRHSFRYLNSLQKEAHHASGIEFMVQFVATKNPVHPQFYRKIMEAMPQHDIIYYYDIDRFHRYSVGSFRELNAAVNIHRRLRELGYDTYIVAFRDGERISVAEANRILQSGQ
jgi:peptidoglycan-associated lipoprotein